MKIEIQAEGMVPDKALMNFVKRRVAFALASFGDVIDSVQVRLVDANEMLMGKDRSCRVQVDFGGRFKALVEALDMDLHVAIHRAVDRAGWTVSRKMQRVRREAAVMREGLVQALPPPASGRVSEQAA